ncbi:cupin domain-containing protein [Rufibacter latericius]|uniref:Cupin domain-containing protein n=1 Tax=Rufibacter latericius TaxID=2487040 RepID=A0A3M9MT90_9BACT|nr:cupin domain-containing protein [Rufibacter latericius]RNI28721.1 cupin domain-containing protein [Rufibacter latericius]
MKRSKFLGILLASAPLLSFNAFSQNRPRKDKGFKVSAGEGRYHGHLKLKGVNANVLDVKVSGKDTNGDLAIFEQTSLSPGRGTPLHVHPHQDEIFQVLAGEYRFQVGPDQHKLTTGDSIFLPRKVPHAWTQVSPSGKMTVMVQPAGRLEEFFVALASFPGDPTKEQMTQLFAAHEMEIVGPPLVIK